MAQATEFSQDFAAALDNKIDDWKFSILPGRVFDKIVQTSTTSFRSQSVHAFVDRATGDLIKAATWKAPQRNVKTGKLAVRFNLATEAGFAEAVEAANFNGGYLYLP